MRLGVKPCTNLDLSLFYNPSLGTYSKSYDSFNTYSQEFCLRRTKKFQKIDKQSSKKIKGLHPAPAAAAPPPPTKVGANCLSAVVLDDQNRDHALSLE